MAPVGCRRRSSSAGPSADRRRRCRPSGPRSRIEPTRHRRRSGKPGRRTGRDSSCRPTYTFHASESGGNGGVWIVTVPTFEATGQATGLRVPLPNCASVQATRPSAAEGSRPIPAGRVTCASLTLDLATFAPPEMNGTSTLTAAPEGESVCVVWGSTSAKSRRGRRPRSAPASRPGAAAIQMPVSHPPAKWSSGLASSEAELASR